MTQNVNEILDSLRQYSPNDTENTQEVLQASSMAVKSLKDQLASLEPIPSTIEPLIEMLTSELANAENHLKSIEGFVSGQYAQSESKVVANIGPGQRILLSQEGSTWKHNRKSSISMADYYLRAQSWQLHGGNNIDKSYESQQGYHPARKSRLDTGGQQHRRLNHDDGQCAAPPGPANMTFGVLSQKEQCTRLAECAINYNLYDLFVYFFGDDIDFGSGSIDENIRVSRDLYDIPWKVRTVVDHKIMCPSLTELCITHGNMPKLFVLV